MTSDGWEDVQHSGFVAVPTNGKLLVSHGGDVVQPHPDYDRPTSVSSQPDRSTQLSIHEQ